MSGRRLVLHIGFPKTGTTAIQRSAVASGRLLKQHGFEIAQLRRDDWVGTTGCCNRFVRQGKVQLALVREAFTATDRHLIVSAESFSRVIDIDELRKLKALADEHFDDIEVLVYLRRQDLAAVSHKQQASKVAGYEHLRKKLRYGHGLGALPENSPHPFLDYERKIGLWLDVFGEDSVTARRYDRKHLVDGDTAADFFQYLGINAGFKKFPAANPALGRLPTFTLYALMTRQVPPPIVAFLRNLLPPSGGKLRPSAAQARAFYEGYRGANIRLNARLGAKDGEDIFDDDYSMYPAEPDDIPSAPELKTGFDDMVDAMLRMAPKTLDDEDLALVRRAANKLSKKDGELATALKLILKRAEAEYPYEEKHRREEKSGKPSEQ